MKSDFQHRVCFSIVAMATTNKKKDESEKEKKFLGRISYKLDYDFDKGAVSYNLNCK